MSVTCSFFFFCGEDTPRKTGMFGRRKGDGKLCLQLLIKGLKNKHYKGVKSYIKCGKIKYNRGKGGFSVSGAPNG